MTAKMRTAVCPQDSVRFEASSVHRDQVRLQKFEIECCNRWPAPLESFSEENQILFSLQTLSRFRILVLVSVDELIKCTPCIGSILGHPDLMQYLFRFRLYRLRMRIQHIRGLVHPAALVTGCLNKFPQAPTKTPTHRRRLQALAHSSHAPSKSATPRASST